MSASADPCASPPSGTLSCYVTTVTAVAAAITFSATGAAPTPLYYEYQQHFGLTPFMITMIFAAYVLCLLLALITARGLQGFATGMAITTLAAIILDTDKERAPLLNSFTAFAGLSAGALGAGALVTFAPAPEQLVFVVLLVLSVVEAAILWFMPETATTKPGALASLRPHVHVPRVARATFAAVTPVNIASWSLGGFYFSLMPSVVRAATDTTLPIVAGLVVATLTLSGAVAVVALRKLVPAKMFIIVIVTLALGVLVAVAGVEYQNVSVMLFGTLVGGIGFGTVFPGTLRSVLPYAHPDERAGLLSAYFVVGYLSFSLPALAAGFLAPIVGLTRTADFYGIGVILLAITSLAIMLLRGRRA